MLRHLDAPVLFRAPDEEAPPKGLSLLTVQRYENYVDRGFYLLTSE